MRVVRWTVDDGSPPRRKGYDSVVKGLLLVLAVVAACGEPADEEAAPVPATVRITVTDEGDWPKFGVYVSLDGNPDAGGAEYEKRTKLKAGAIVTFQDVPPGPATVWLTGDRFFRRLAVDVPSGGELDLKIPLPTGATIEGVVSHRDRGPVSKAHLCIDTRQGEYDDTFRLLASESGRFRLRRAPAGRQPVRVSGASIGRVMWPRAVLDIPPMGTHRRDIVLGRTSLVVVVRDQETGAPVSDVFLSAWPRLVLVRTGGNGSYRFDDLLPGPVTLVAVRKGYDSVRRQLVITRDATLDINLELPPR